MSVERLCPLRNPLYPVSISYVFCENSKKTQCGSNEAHCLDSNIPSFGMQQFKKGKKCQTITQVPITLKKGNINDNFQLTGEQKSKESASASAIAFGIHIKTNHPVVFKGFTVFENPRYNTPIPGLLHEIEMYQKMKLLAKQVPHFVNMVALYETPCNDTTFYENQHIIAAGKILTEDNKPSKKTPHKHMILVLTAIKGPSLLDYFKIPQHDTVWMSVMFQVLFSLHVMFQLGFQHNDLHTKNILIDQNPGCDSALYVIGSDIYNVNLPVKIYIYDFDLGSCCNCEQNFFLKNTCEDYGVCQERNPKFDVYTFFRHMQDLEPNKKMQGIIGGILGRDKLLEKFKKRFYSPDYEPPKPASVMLPLTAIKTYFSDFKIIK